MIQKLKKGNADRSFGRFKKFLHDTISAIRKWMSTKLWLIRAVSDHIFIQLYIRKILFIILLISCFLR
jgi:hypothetical protein